MENATHALKEIIWTQMEHAHHAAKIAYNVTVKLVNYVLLECTLVETLA